jgi:type IV pilus secretin PilQ/predicted competence protein
MRLRLNAMRQLGLVAALLTLTCVALASSRLTAVEMSKDQGDSLTVVLNLQGETPEVTTLRFPEARQAVVVLKGTLLDMDQRSWKDPGAPVKAMVVRSLTGTGGEPSVQVTLDLVAGAGVDVQSADGQVAIAVKPSQQAKADPVSSDRPILLSNADLLSDNPQFGHGQDAGKQVMQGFQGYYTPEDVPETGPRTQEERELLLAEEIFQQRVTLDFKDAELQNVIRLLAAKTNLNIIMSKDVVRGTITLKLTNVPLGVALDAILKTNGLAFIVERGGIVRIVPISEVRTDKVVTRTEYFPVNWVTAGNLAKTLQPFLSNEGTIQADMDSNGIIVTDVPERVEQISRLIERIDLPEKQVMIEARLVDLTDAAERSLGINWQIYKDQPGTAEDPLLSTDIITKGTDPTILDTGTNWIASRTNSFSIFGEDYLLDVALNALEKRNEAAVLANPKVITLNNLMARIEIIRELPYISAQQTGENAIGTVEFKETGVILEVTPNITNNGYVRMSLKPEQKVRKDDFELGTDRFVPVVDERLVESSVIVKDEETVVLGGLRQIDNLVSEEGWPFLMRIPVLGWFFKNERTLMEKTELVLFVTPHIVKDPTLSAEELRQYEQIDYNWDLPDYFYDETRLRETAPVEEQ